MDASGSQPPALQLAFLLVFRFYLAIVETALASASRTKIKTIADRGDTRAKRALKAIDDFDNAITTILIYTNIVSITIATVVTVYVTRVWGMGTVGLSTVITTVVIFFACEMLPKTIAKKKSEPILLVCAGILGFLMKLVRPVAKLLTYIGKNASRKGQEEAEATVTEDELQDLIEDMAEEGSLDENQSDLISSALTFGDVTVESILTPRVDLVALDISKSRDEILEFVKSQNHSRIPVYEGTIDNIIGVLQIRKYMKAYLTRKMPPLIRPLLDKVYFAHQSTQIDDLLTSMSKNRLNMAVITDSYGGTLGIVTVEDILEELVGDIWDEEDVVLEAFTKVSNDIYLVDPDQTVSDTFDYIGFEDPEEDEKDEANLLVGEWVYEHFNSIPKAGDSFDYYNLHITVAMIEHNRILKVEFKVKEVLIPKLRENDDDQNREAEE